MSLPRLFITMLLNFLNMYIHPIDSGQKSLLLIFIILFGSSTPSCLMMSKLLNLAVPKHLLLYSLSARHFLLQLNWFDFYLLHMILSFPHFTFNILLPSSRIPLLIPPGLYLTPFMIYPTPHKLFSYSVFLADHILDLRHILL